jgi:hypothetical protein
LISAGVGVPGGTIRLSGTMLQLVNSKASEINTNERAKDWGRFFIFTADVERFGFARIAPPP